MATFNWDNYKNAAPVMRQIEDDRTATRQVDGINHFWKTLAVDPEMLRPT